MPLDLNTALSIVGWIISQEPKVEGELRAIFGKNDPTQTDWAAERQNWINGDYNSIVTASKLPPVA